MAYTLDEFAKLDSNPEKGSSCTKCGSKLDKSAGEPHRVEEGLLCGDCYYDALSDVIDEHPVGKP